MRFHYDTDYRQTKRVLRYPAERLSYGLLLGALLCAPFLLSPFYLGELTYLLILCVASLGLMILTGYTGQVSLGHAAFIGIGAYTHAWCLAHGLPFTLSVLCAMAVAGCAGLVIGLPAIRISGLYLAMVTLAFAILVEHGLGRWKSVTGGFNGMAVADPVLFGLDLGGMKGFYFLCLALTVLVLLGLLNLTRGKVGRAFIGVRDSEAAAAGLGINVSAYKVLAFVMSAAISGLAGVLLAHHIKFLTPEGFNLVFSMELVLMVVIGGLGSLRGAILGAVLIGLLPQMIAHLKPLLPSAVAGRFGLEIFVFGAVLAFFVLFEPRGINGRWLKVHSFFAFFPLYRKDTFKRVKSYMHSERDK